MKGRKRTLRKGLSGKILSFTMALAMVANLMGGYCAATELSTKEVKAADAEQPPYRNVMYYGDWSIYSGQKNFTPDKIDGSLIRRPDRHMKQELWNPVWMQMQMVI